LLISKKFKEASIKYLELANRLSKRKDFGMSSLMVLCHGLALLKSGESLKIIKKSVKQFLDNLGINKRLVEETFYIMLILFLIDIRLFDFDGYLLKTKEMLEILPLFKEEKTLIEIEEN
jgi:hypothetical protein